MHFPQKCPHRRSDAAGWCGTSFSGDLPYPRRALILGGNGEPHHIGLALNDLSDSCGPSVQCHALFCGALIVVVMPAGNIGADMVEDRTYVLGWDARLG